MGFLLNVIQNSLNEYLVMHKVSFQYVLGSFDIEFALQYYKK